MGGLVQTGPTEYCAWTGGKPKADWSGLDSTAAAVPKDAYQYRPTSPGAAQKSNMHREQGLDIKFDMKSNLTDLRETMNEYFVRTGMDTIAYLPNPQAPSEMLCVIDHYSRFDPASASASSKKFRETVFDSYDVANDDSARRWLLNTLSDELRAKVKDRTPSMSGFVAHWMVFLHCFQSSSHAKYDKLKKDIEAKQITEYPQQNVSQLATDFLHLGTELTNHSMYEQHRLTQTMLNRFLAAGGGDASDIYAMQYRYPLLSLQSRLDKALNYIAHLDKPAANAYMVKAELTFRDICQVAEEEWKKLVDNGTWGPAKTRLDNRRLPTNFGANASSTDTSLLLKALALVQQQQSSSSAINKADDTCLNCGQSGHWARNCPQKKGGSSRPGSQQSRKGVDFRRRAPDESGPEPTRRSPMAGTKETAAPKKMETDRIWLPLQVMVGHRYRLCDSSILTLLEVLMT